VGLQKFRYAEYRSEKTIFMMLKERLSGVVRGMLDGRSNA
jgi:hypothetical protein